MKPRLLMAARMHYDLPLPAGTERKFAALRERFELRVLAAAGNGRPLDDGVFHLTARPPLLDGLLFYLLLPLRVRRLARSHRPDAIIAQSPYEGALIWLARTGVPLIVEVHGDWRSSTRLYGSPLRRLLAPVTDAIGPFALRRADAVRTLSPYTSSLVRSVGVEPVGEFPTFADLGAFSDHPTVPLPAEPVALFVGVFELYKNIDGLARAWREAAARVPAARLVLVGQGPRREVVEALLRDLPGQTTWVERLDPAGVSDALDAATCLLLPSRSEGLGRVLIEAFLRGRPAVGMAVGGIRDVIVDGDNGLLVEPGDPDALTAAIERILTDRELAVRLGEGATRSAPGWVSSPSEYADRVLGVVEAVVAAPRS